MRTKIKLLNTEVRKVYKGISLLMVLCTLVIPESTMAVGTWVPLAATAPNGSEIGTMILLSDGTVMAQELSNTYPVWYRLTPDNNGSYVNGTWSSIHSMNWPRLYYSSDVVPDGRVFVAGAEESLPGGGNTAEIYDPLIDGWTLLSVPTNLVAPNDPYGFADSSSVVLPSGKVLIAPVGPVAPNGTVIYDPVANSWAAGPPSVAYLDEASWVKLPDGSVLTADPDNSHSERYIPSLNQWIRDATVPVSLYSNGETGAALLLPNGKAIFFGGGGHTALYTPSGNNNNGTWTVGPDIPGGIGIADSPEAMMVNGKVLLMTASAEGNGGNHGPYNFYEYDYSVGVNGAYTATGSPENNTAGSVANTTECSCFFRFLDLPDGNVLASFGSYHVGQLYIYQPDGSPVAAGKPAIASITKNANGSFHLTGTGLNGISQGAYFGDDAQMDSNYPLVRMTNTVTGAVYYARTYNWSSTDVMTGARMVTTEFTLPTTIPVGTYSLVAVANGIASDPMIFPAPVWVDFNYSGSTQIGSYAFPFKTLAQGVNAVAAGGTIFIKTSGSSFETTTISKPMTIEALGGAAIIGR